MDQPGRCLKEIMEKGPVIYYDLFKGPVIYCNLFKGPVIYCNLFLEVKAVTEPSDGFRSSL